MTRGGHRAGAGRPKGSTKPQEQLAKRYTFRLYEDEVPYIKGIIKRLHEQKRKATKDETKRKNIYE